MQPWKTSFEKKIHYTWNKYFDLSFTGMAFNKNNDNQKSNKNKSVFGQTQKTW